MKERKEQLAQNAKKQRKWEKKRKKKLRKLVKKYDTVGALWLDEKTTDLKQISALSIMSYHKSLYKEKDRHYGNKYFFQLELMLKMLVQQNCIEDLEIKVKKLESKLPINF